jgi:hypothetical protein
MSTVISPKFEPDDDNRVLPFAHWCELAGFSKATGRRVLASGEGPIVTHLSTRRIGIRVRDHKRWLDRRARTPCTASWTR